LVPGLFFAQHYSSDSTGLTAGSVASISLGIALFGCAYIAIGVFASAVTRSQIIAVIVGLAIGGALFCCVFLDGAFPTQGDGIGRLVSYLALTEHMRSFSQGVVDIRPVVLCLSLTALFLLLTWKAVESRRWK
jgi:ABC-2 type transport system permease protein